MKKIVGKDKSQKLAEKISQFNNLPDVCSACLLPFDKTSKEMALTWNVIVKNSDTVRLYCPSCWSQAKSLVEEFKERVTTRNKENENTKII